MCFECPSSKPPEWTGRHGTVLITSQPAPILVAEVFGLAQIGREPRISQLISRLLIACLHGSRTAATEMLWREQLETWLMSCLEIIAALRSLLPDSRRLYKGAGNRYRRAAVFRFSFLCFIFIWWGKSTLLNIIQISAKQWLHHLAAGSEWWWKIEIDK